MPSFFLLRRTETAFPPLAGSLLYTAQTLHSFAIHDPHLLAQTHASSYGVDYSALPVLNAEAVFIEYNNVA